MTKPLEPPETLGYYRSGNIPDRPGPVTTVHRSAGPPLYRADRWATPDRPTPNWLAQHIENTRRTTRFRTCPHCHLEILVGPDHDRCSLTARVDPTPADRLTEVIALLSGRHSYDLDRGRLHHREPEHHHSPNRRYPVLLEHRCPQDAS